jgi:hypothetical protein
MEYDKELATRLLTETMRELPGYLVSVKAKEDDKAFRYNIGSSISPCEVFAPADFDFKTDTSGSYFIWKGGYFCIGKMWSLPGDVNSDDKVDITDVVKTVNYILGNTSGQFDKEAADINKDNNIDISDVVSLVNMILGQ